MKDKVEIISLIIGVVLGIIFLILIWDSLTGLFLWFASIVTSAFWTILLLVIVVIILIGAISSN